MKTIMEQWGALSDQQKAPYVQLAEHDKQRLEREKAQLEELGYFVSADGVKSTDIALAKPKFLPHVHEPKNVMTPYTCFIKDNYASVKALNPDIKFTGMLPKIAEMWHELSDEQKIPYVKLSEADRERYDRQFNELLTQGFFIREDGARSNEKSKRTKAVSETQPDLGSKRAKESVQSEGTKRLKK